MYWFQGQWALQTEKPSEGGLRRSGLGTERRVGSLASGLLGPKLTQRHRDCWMGA